MLLLSSKIDLQAGWSCFKLKFSFIFESKHYLSFYFTIVTIANLIIFFHLDSCSIILLALVENLLFYQLVYLVYALNLLHL